MSAYGPDGPSSDLPGTDAVGQAIGGITEAFSVPGQQMRTGVASVADETCAILTLSGILAALIHAKNTGIGQKVETSLIGSAFRLMGWTMTTAMWKNIPPITGARINGSRNKAGIAACFNDIDGKPLAIQLNSKQWTSCMDKLGFLENLKNKGLDDLGLAIESEQKKNEILNELSKMFAKNKRSFWIKTMRDSKLVAAPVNSMIEASNDPDIIANNYVSEVFHPEIGENIKVHGTPWKFSETPSKFGLAPKLGENNHEILENLGFNKNQIKQFETDQII